MQKIKQIFIKAKYNGGFEVRAIFEDGETIIIEDAEKAFMLLGDAINTQGFTVARGPYEKYKRLTINK